MRATIKLKLAATFTILTALAAILAWLGISSLASLNATVAEITNGSVVRMKRADELQLAIMSITPSEKNMIMAETPEEVRDIGAELLRRRGVFLKKFENMQTIATDQVRQKLAAVAPNWVKWTGLQDRERELMEHNGQTEAKKLSARDSKVTRNEIVRQLEEIDELETQLMKSGERRRRQPI